MEFHVEGVAPDGPHAQAPYRGWVLAASHAAGRPEFDLLVSDESSGAGSKRLRTVPQTSVNCHHFEPSTEEPIK